MSLDRGGVSIIAEAGVNHDGKLDRALKLVDAAAMAGADIVKFQIFHATELVATTAPKAAYQKTRTATHESQSAMLQRLELAEPDFVRLADHARGAGIKFLATPFDLRSLRFLARDLNLPTVKIGSGDLTNAPLLVEAARLGRDVILSTGMSTLQEVAEALGALAFGYLNAGVPSEKPFTVALASPAGRAALK